MPQLKVSDSNEEYFAQNRSLRLFFMENLLAHILLQLPRWRSATWRKYPLCIFANSYRLNFMPANVCPHLSFFLCLTCTWLTCSLWITEFLTTFSLFLFCLYAFDVLPPPSIALTGSPALRNFLYITSIAGLKSKETKTASMLCIIQALRPSILPSFSLQTHHSH